MIGAALANVAGDTLLRLVRHAAARRPRLLPPTRTLVIPPAVPGSLGDAAMLACSVHCARARGARGVDLAFGGDWVLDARVDGRLAAERFFYHGHPVEHALVLARLPRYAEVYFVGADVIDGAYNPRSVCARLGLLADAARLGRRAVLLGASYNAHPEASTRAALRALPREVVICARDPRSKTRLEQATDRAVRQVADLAFLLAPRHDCPIVAAARAWIDARRADGDRVVGLNANYLHAEHDARLPEALRTLLEGLVARGLSVLLVPHDTRSRRPDRMLLEGAAARLSPEARARVRTLPPVSPGVVAAVLSAVDLMIGGRMHAAILALSSGTPAYCFTYQDKFEGLLALFDLESGALCATPRQLVEHTDAVLARTLSALEAAPRMRRQIEAKLPAVKALARLNFA
ncbi:MAG: polysaccharide pyruvyl transferase family protein [Polyangiales bacterium]